jgi:hypothetical protein
MVLLDDLALAVRSRVPKYGHGWEGIVITW